MKFETSNVDQLASKKEILDYFDKVVVKLKTQFNVKFYFNSESFNFY